MVRFDHNARQRIRMKAHTIIAVVVLVTVGGLYPRIARTPIISGTISASERITKFLEYSGKEADCETEMSHLDNYAIALQTDATAIGYIIAFGSDRSTARHEMKARRLRIKRYLVKNRHLDPNRVVVIDGGFRKNLTIQLWLVPQGENPPRATPTVSRKDVRFKRTRHRFDCSSFY